MDASRIEPQGAAVGRRTSGTRPAVAALTDDPLLTVIEIDVAATDKSQWLLYYISGTVHEVV